MHPALLGGRRRTLEGLERMSRTSHSPTITDVATLRWVFRALLALSIAFYIGGHLRKSREGIGFPC
jgi:hypothetical protein